jgi:hypothetical protein
VVASTPVFVSLEFRSAHILRVADIGNWHLLLQTNEATCILPRTGGVRVFVRENLALYGAYTPGTMFPSS